VSVACMEAGWVTATFVLPRVGRHATSRGDCPAKRGYEDCPRRPESGRYDARKRSMAVVSLASAAAGTGRSNQAALTRPSRLTWCRLLQHC
jgi:hypothetical protein